MGKMVSLFFCILIVALDIAAGVLGCQAEAAQNKVKHLRLWIFECRDPSNGAVKLGLAAAGLLILSHVIANLLSGCLCICSQDQLQRASSHKQLSVACFFFTWIIFGIGLTMLVIGSLANHKSSASCGFTHHHFFSIGGILCFVHALFSVAYYISATALASEEISFIVRHSSNRVKF
ncbi:Protein VASCULATURE COMPLEXITY AND CONNECTIVITY [Linum perenne]